MTSGKRGYKVFISSTYLDNADRRKVVEDAVLHAEMHPVGMERFIPSAQTTVEECRRLARESDIYIGIVAHRYGWIPEDAERSITELEYDAAKKAGRPCFLFQIDPALPVNIEQDFDPGPDRWDKQKLLEAFVHRCKADQMLALFNEMTLGTKILRRLLEWRHEVEAHDVEGDPETPPHGRRAASQNPTELERYREAMVPLHTTLELAGFKTRLRVPIDLEELYVSLHAMVDLRAVGDAAFADAAEARERLHEAQGTREIPLIDAFREVASRKRLGLVILGDPGSGKTTHLKWLFLWCLRHGAAGLGLSADVVPVYLPLRELKDISRGLDAFIEREHVKPHFGMRPGFGTRLLERGRLLLLFDGLDEVSDAAERTRVARWLEDAARSRPSCHSVVTCRFAGYGEGTRLGPEFLELHLRPMTREQSESFIRNWYRVVETGLASERAQGEMIAYSHAEGLIERLEQPDFRAARMLEMTRNPLLLASLCLIHRNRGDLPQRRVRLYEECVDVLLERWREGKGLRVNITALAGRRVLQPVALWLHEREGRVRAAAGELAPALDGALEAVQWKGGSAREFLRTVRDESGLLTGWAQDQYGFMHLGFQEYLAACELRRRAFEGDRAVLTALAERYDQSWWQEVILMLLAQGNPSLFTHFMREVVRNRAFAEDSQLLDLILEEAVEVSDAPFIELLDEQAEADPSLEVRQIKALRAIERIGGEASLKALAHTLVSHPSKAVRRWLAEREAAAVRDSRTSRMGGVELVRIPEGAFTMGSPGSDAGRFEHEGPEHRVDVSVFYLGRYSVTNEEYGRFLAADPGVPEPPFWSDRRFNQSRQPVVGVSWEDARRFADWAGGRLPTEAEWEYAARAGTTSAYPWGSAVGKNRANCAGCGSQWDNKQTSPVGSFDPNAFGLYDMHGNVWEWVQDCWHDSYEGAPADGTAWEGGGDCTLRVVRGCSWLNEPRFLRVSNRFRDWPGYRGNYLGFRLAQDL